MKKIFNDQVYFLLCMFFSISTQAELCRNQVKNQSSHLEASLRNFILDNGNVYSKTPVQKEWVDQQNLKSTDFLKQSPLYEQLKTRNTELNSASPSIKIQTVNGLAFVKAGSLFIERNSTETVLVDKSILDGSVVSDFKVSPDGKKIAFSVSRNGSDSFFWRVFDVVENQVTTDTPTRVRIYDFNWSPESDGFFYSLWPQLESEFQMVSQQQNRLKGVDVAFHKLGTNAADDVVVFKNPFLSTNFAVAKVSGQKLFIAHRTKLGFAHQLHALYGRKDQQGKIDWLAFDFPADSVGRFVFATQEFSVFLSSEVGNHYGLVAYSNQTGKFLKVIRHAGKKIMAQAQRVGDFLVVQYFDHSFRNSIEILNLDGQHEHTLSFEKLGLSARGALPQTFNVRSGSPQFQFIYNGIEQPNVTVSFDIKTKQVEVKKSPLAIAFDPQFISSEVLSVKTPSGVPVPVQIYTSKNGPKPRYAYLAYYGSNGILNPSTFSRKIQMHIELGAMIVMVGPRGGGERGANWYKEGMKDRMNSVNDVVEVSRWLKEKYPHIQSRVVASGRSYGGMLTYALAVHAPEDFSILIPVVGIGDLEYYKSDYHGSIGWDDLGYSRDHTGQLIVDEATNQKVRQFSPHLNVGKMKSTPAILSVVGAQDERVGPHQGYVMTQALQEKFEHSSIYLLEQPGGHNARTEAVEEVAFVAQVFGFADMNVIFR